jgi:radical SAM superfamily enzyme YgiQ (UPF0313 family)
LRNKIKVVFRVFPFNRLTFPLLLNVWEQNGIDRCFDIRIWERDGRKELGDLGRGDAIVYSFMTPHVPLIAAEIERLRKEFPPERRPLLAAGGPHVSGEQELALAIGLDRVFAGDGEDLFLRFGRDLLSGESGQDPVVHEDRGMPQHAPTAWERYIPVSRYMKTVPPLEIMRGCFWRCRYCQTGSRKPLFRSLDSVDRYLGEAANRGAKRISFISPSALEFGASGPGAGRFDPGPIDRLLALSRSRGFRFVEYGVFPSEIRPDTVTDDALALLERSVSNRKLTIGGQSGVDERLKLILRGHGTEEVERAVALANNRGFRVNLDLILAFPGETTNERAENADFIRRIGRRYRLRVQLHHFFPLSGSPFEFRLPSFLDDSERETWLKLKQEGVVTDWWAEGEKQALSYFRWLKRRFPRYSERYG